MIGYDSLAEGQALPPLTKAAITTRQLVQYAGASGDFNRIHYDDPFAREAGYQTVIAHGMLSMAFLGQVVTDWAGATATVAALSTRFKAITFPGDVVTCAGTVSRKYLHEGRRAVDLTLTARTQAGTVTLEGAATVTWP